jgi:transposase InsO family protein
VVKRTLEGVFRHWGMPKAIRVDNGKPFGDPQRTLVSPLGLWLAGLGVTLICNPPRSPRLNAKVERMPSTTARWAEIENCSSCCQLQKKLDAIAVLQREKYVSRRLGKSRRVLYNARWKNSRKYNAHSFCAEKTYKYLTKVIFKRKINKIGFLTFYAQSV